MLRITHATLGVHCFHAGPEGNLIIPNCESVYEPDVLTFRARHFPELCFLYLQERSALDEKLWREKTTLEPSCPLHGLKAVCCLCSFPSAVKHPGVQTLLFIYIRQRNILPHSKNTFAENNPMLFLFRGMFYCYLSFLCVQKRLISSFPPPR